MSPLKQNSAPVARTVRVRVGLADLGLAVVAYKADMSRGKILLMPGLG